MTSIALVNFARTGSSRVPGKVLKKVGAYSLLSKSLLLMRSLDCTSFVVCPDYDKEIITRTESFGVNIRTMTEEQSKADLWPELIKPILAELQTYDYVWDANLICHPFLTKPTCDWILQDIRSNLYPHPVMYALPERNPLFSSEGIQFWSAGELANTQANALYYKPSHIGYIWPSRFTHMSEEQISFFVKPVALSLSKLEQIDIDTEEDLELANLVVRGMRE